MKRISSSKKAKRRPPIKEQAKAAIERDWEFLCNRFPGLWVVYLGGLQLAIVRKMRVPITAVCRRELGPSIARKVIYAKIPAKDKQ